ncbi:MAG: hypothetical protein A2358_02260 [Candidatus Staskawiczbacteria bacterium RIFOXYB1_FULL_37_44]|uniref:Uncharacterized protein n=1 Tax=Candidatus Staskawiczbacteria bacterium RIFOXYB1_FULL_37_44 TaxID=1802223 RepID=A0A1G2IV20_9BACT|nr:MAG: hypothetical protein A2358_02260 [Candidatus Staskawiczbacteria bacterium RIFOXYB1_FULL_37_44]OGZ82811.1 MAG: hypothetical protein A2416_03240 [Candidatus Staskawiczbacteria bacterium RIFOXYC1_FULL_37_52]OGZ89759.1 MAG: hypothetical protein A2444_01240 [Candidatus Staskawiczbacteria bacterium RIFOXYC2_FULL_37_19]OGZ90582.1 MAG: hypothetical protein A2581_02700 [Candidatus Staskawiczbacteria bacterium RIFOXYD1_FULL_37_110]
MAEPGEKSKSAEEYAEELTKAIFGSDATPTTESTPAPTTEPAPVATAEPATIAVPPVIETKSTGPEVQPTEDPITKAIRENKERIIKDREERATAAAAAKVKPAITPSPVLVKPADGIISAEDRKKIAKDEAERKAKKATKTPPTTEAKPETTPPTPDTAPKPVSTTELAEPAPAEAETTISESPAEKYLKEKQKTLYEKLTNEARLEKPLWEAGAKILDADIDQKHEEFLLKWFNDNKNSPEIQRFGITENISDAQKRKIAIDNGAFTKLISDEKYAKEFQEIENLSNLRLDFNSENVSLASQFLMLNHLEQKQNQTEEFLKIRLELAKKATGIDIEATAEKELSGPDFQTKENYVDTQTAGLAQKINSERNKELVDIEWHEYMSMGEKERREYCSELGWRLEIPRKVFDKLSKNKNYTPEQADEAFQNYNREMFGKAITMIAAKNGIEGQAFYGLLEQGYKPHEAKSKFSLFKIFTMKMSWTEIPNKGGSVYASDGTKEGFASFLKKTGEDYGKSFSAKAKEELENEWQNNYDLKKSERIMAMLSQTTENAKKHIVENYEAIKNRLIEEAETKRVKSKTEKELKEIEKEFGDDGKAKKPEKRKTMFESFSELAGDALKDDDGNRKGGLEKLTGELKDDADILSDYFNKKLGVKEMTSAKLKQLLKEKAIPEDDYKEKWNDDYGLLDWFTGVMVDRLWEAKPKKKKPVKAKTK